MSQCQKCGGDILHRRKASAAERAERKFCSKLCANQSHELTPMFDRMIAKVEKQAGTGCWLYTGSKDGRGYGTVSTRRSEAPAKAHRVSYEHHHGPIPEGLSVCHACDTPACVNPEHLFLGTQRDNVMDCWRKGRNNKECLGNLRPGAPGFRGAGPTPSRDINQ